MAPDALEPGKTFAPHDHFAVTDRARSFAFWLGLVVALMSFHRTAQASLAVRVDRSDAATVAAVYGLH